MVEPEWRRLRSICTDLSPLLHGDVRNFLIEPYGPANVSGAITWIRATILGDSVGHATTIALKIRTSDWTAVKHSTCALKALQARLQDEPPCPVLDLTGPDAVLVAALQVERGEQLQVAEVFCGGFSGISQAITLLHKAAVPIHTAWRLDWDPLVQPYLCAQVPNLCVASSLSELDEAQPHQELLLQANADDNWWISTFARCPIDILASSAPCPAWSSAGRARGLRSGEGCLLLRMADVCSALEIPAVLIEQVANFPRHEDFGAVMAGWKEAGYTCKWSQTLDLLDVLPGCFLAVLVHTSALSCGELLPQSWSKGKRPTLASAQIVLPLPQALLKPLIPSHEVLSMYADPALVPNPRGRARPQAPLHFRVKKKEDTATCFMARYTKQHELPLSLLRQNGLMGCLLSDGDHLRFFSSAEISCLHGMHEPLWISGSTEANMQVVGNSISVPHAMAGLFFALQALGYDKGCSLADRIDLVLQGRMQAGNSVFLPAEDGWLLIHQDKLSARLAQAMPSLALTARLFSGLGFACVRFVASDQTVDLLVDLWTPVDQLFRHLGLNSFQASKLKVGCTVTPGTLNLPRLFRLIISLCYGGARRSPAFSSWRCVYEWLNLWRCPAPSLPLKAPRLRLQSISPV